MTENYFCVCHKIRESGTNILNCFFSKLIYPSAHQTKHLNELLHFKFTFYKQCLFGLLFSTNINRTLTHQSILHLFVLSFEKNVSQTFKCSSRVFLQCVCYWSNLLRRMFFIPCDNWKWLFFYKGLLVRASNWGLSQPSYYSVLWKKCFERGSNFTSSPE